MRHSAQLADKKIAYAILLARLSSAALTGRSEGMGESKSACGICSMDLFFKIVWENATITLTLLCVNVIT